MPGNEYSEHRLAGYLSRNRCIVADIGRERETDFGVADPFRESAVRGARVGEAGLAADLKAYRGDRRWLDEDGGSISRRVEEDRDETVERGRESGLVDAWESWAPAGWCSTLHR